jgi:general secretion pathway protein J
MKPISRGFTLIEILVAVAIFGLLSVGAYTVLDAGMRSRQQTESRLSKLEALQRTMQFIEKDLRMLSLRQVRDEFGDKIPLLRGQSEQSGQESYLEFTRSDWRNPAGLPRSNLQHLSYKFEKGSLTRLHTIFLDQASNSPKVVQTLLEDLQAFNLTFLDQQQQWQNSWSMFGSIDEDQLTLPTAVRVRLEMEPFGLIERIILIADIAQQTESVEEPNET